MLARPYPRAVAGTPQSFGFDPATKRFDLVYSTRAPDGHELGERLPRGELTEVFLPQIQYPDGYSVEVSGATGRLASPTSACSKLERRVERRPSPSRVTPD